MINTLLEMISLVVLMAAMDNDDHKSGLKEEALKRTAVKDNDDHKPGLKLSIGYLLKNAASILKAQRIINKGIDKAEEVDQFLCVLKLHWDSIFYHSQIAIEKGRQSNLRKPRNLPLEAKLKLTRSNNTYNFCEAVMQILKDRILCRLKAFNLNQLVDFILSRLEHYYEHRLVDVANNTVRAA